MGFIRYICPVVLFIFSVLAFFYGINLLWSEDRKDTENKLLTAFCIGSGIWSLGFGALIVQTDPEIAYYCRAVGMVGTMMYLMTVQVLVCYLSGINKILARVINSFAATGIIVYFLTVDKDQTIFHLDASGMTYSFKPGLANTIYTAYSLILAVIMLGISIYMCFSKMKRNRHFGRIFLATVALMLFGTVLDTVFPLLGIPAIPGSTLTQFWGMAVIYIAIRANNRSKINIANMSEFIYYSLSMPVLVYDADGRLKIANDAAAEHLGVNRDLIPQENIPLGELFDMDDSIIFNFEGKNRDTNAVCKHKQIYCNLAINKIQDRYNDIIGYIVIATDLSELRKNMQLLEEAKQEAETANRSKSAFLANMSHEIRTPMNAILGFSELLLKMDTSETVREYAADIKSSCQNLLAVINDILDISKLDSGKMELSCHNYYTNNLLQDVYHIIDIQARKKGLYFQMNADPRIPNELYGDVTRVRGILINILNNAVKYTADGGISFNIKLLDIVEDAAILEYSVTDTGIGIKKEAMEHLFDSFARFDLEKNNKIEGSGLGLSIVNGYVKLMNGDIKVDSIYGRGTTFTVTLSQKIINSAPMEYRPEAAQENSSLNAGELKIRYTRVLVTDDNQINLKVIKNTLEHYGFDVDTASNGADAISLCKETAYDLVFMDQMMPGMDGIETMKQIRTLSAHYAYGGMGKIIVLTANAIAGVRKELMDQGFDEYLSKPLNFRALEHVMTRFIPAEKFVGVLPSSPDAKAPKPSLAKLLPEINVTAGLNLCGGNINLYMEVLHMLHEDSPAQLEELKRLYAEKDFENYTVQIHSLKGQLLNVGYTDLGEAARDLEFASREGRYEYIDTHMERFLIKYQELLTQLEKVFLTLES